MPSHRVFSTLRIACALLSLASLVRADEPKETESKLRPPALTPLPLGSIKPKGWLRDQLKIQAAGLSGHLDEFWPDIKDSSWLGGKAEGWERLPYWLDGIVPLAFSLDDDALKAKAKKVIDHVLDHQAEDGWMGPVSDGKHEAYDPWPLYVMFKALTQYQEATGDKRIIPAIEKCLRKIDDVITKKPLHSWAQYRAADLILTIDWIYDRTHEDWLLKLADKVHAQAFDWRKHFENFPYKGPVLKNHGMDTHGVNTAMGLKFGAVWYRHSGEKADRDMIFQALEVLDKYHGQANGMFSCDEHLAGRSPVQGTELCTVVEMMYSLEVAISITGEPRLGDRLEKIAFNALPATFKPDMCAHQYDQQANQVIAKLSPDHVYYTNGPDSNLFGLEPNFGCCTANMHQGWPKFAANLVLRKPDGGLAMVAISPSEIAIDPKDQDKGTLEIKTDYPFDDSVLIAITSEAPKTFDFSGRLPDWSDPKETLTFFGNRDLGPAFNRFPKDSLGLSILLKGPFGNIGFRLRPKSRLTRRDRDGISIERGPLVFALPIRTYWKLLKGNPPFGDWEVFPMSAWNYALQIDPLFPEESIAFETKKLSRHPFSPDSPPIVAKVKGKRVPWWTLERNAAGQTPRSPVESDQPLEDLTLAPYGCTTLRVTEFPLLKTRP